MKRLSLALVVAAGCARATHAPEAGAPDRLVEDASPRPEASSPDPGSVVSLPDASPDEEMHVEAAEKNPRSPTVKLKMIITPAAHGTVVWGRRKIAELKPGQMTVEIERPRASGPLDVLIRADGFLPHHVRLFSDRDDRLNVHLYHPEDARGLLGYRR